MSFPNPSLLSRLSSVFLSTLLFHLMGGLWFSIPQAQSSPTRTRPADGKGTLPLQMAQADGTAPSQCYWSTLQMGVYQEPNPFSTALGVLPAGAIVLIGPGSGQGWVRLQAPVMGWMLATGLQGNPLQGCNGLGTIVPVGGTANTVPVSTPASVPVFVPVKDTPILCTVVPPTGLPVRNQPILHPRTLTAILEPGLHRFEFSDRQVRLESFNQVRDWFYITAPVTGWISPRIVGNPTVDLTGEGCP